MHSYTPTSKVLGVTEQRADTKHPRRADTEHLSEMVFGTIDLSEKSSGYKVHPIDARNTLWSKLFYARKDDVLNPGSRRAVVARLVRTICQINLR